MKAPATRAIACLLALALSALYAGCAATDPPLPQAPFPLTAPTASVAATAPVSAADTPTPQPSDVGTDTDALALAISVAPIPQGLPAYNRSDWRHWIDADHDCQDARQEALIAESRAPVRYARPDRCRVSSGDWFGQYTGERFTDPGDLDIDHMVPLANAHRSGGWQWSKDRKRDYANDLSYPNHLIAVQSSANRRKGSKGPEDWKPPRREYWCQYATDWAAVKQAWGLTATQREAAALQEMLTTCEQPATLTIVAVEDPPQPPTPPPAALEGEAQSPSTDVELRYDPHGPDRDCGDFQTHAQAQAFYEAAGGPAQDPHRLDADGDGIACASLR